MADVKKLVPIIKQWEGGFSNDPLDSGGATMMGITLVTYKYYCKLNGKPEPSVNDLKYISSSDWMAVLKKLYWDKWKADEINNQSVANILVDWLWASGSYGIKIPQKVLGVVADGVVGKITIEKLNSQSQDVFFNKIQQERRSFVVGIVKRKPSQVRFLKGWLNRINSFKYYENVS